MNATLSTNIRLALSVLGLLFSSVVLMIALVAIQAMSGSEPFREPLTFYTVSVALAGFTLSPRSVLRPPAGIVLM